MIKPVKTLQENNGQVDISYVTLQKIVDSSLDIICQIDMSGRFVWLNNACERIWGYKVHELVGKKYLDFVVAADHEGTQLVASQIIAGRDFTNFDNHYVRKDGSIVPMVWSATWDVSEQTMYCVARDATEKVTAQMKLQESEHSLKEAMRIAKIGTWTYDPLTNESAWSEELYDIYGVDARQRRDLIPLFTSMVHEEDATLVQEAFLNADAFTAPFTHRLIRPDGRIIHVKHRILNKSNRAGSSTLITGTTQDVSDEVSHETQLLLREQKFKSLLANNLDMVGIIDSGGSYSYVSENTEKLLGYKPDFLVGKNAFEFIHPEDVQTVFERFSTLNKKVRELDIPAFRFKSAAGDWRWIECRLSDKTDDSSIQGIIVNSRDVSLKKADDDKILSLSRIAEETPNAVVRTDVDGNINWVNKAFEEITEYSAEESYGRKPGDLLQGKNSNPVTIALMRQRLLEKKPFEVEIINYAKSGKAYWMNIQCQPQFDVHGKQIGFFAIQTDITEKKNLQERLNAELEKKQMEITAKIVKAQEKERDEIGKELHDNINQMLSTVKLYLGMLKEPQLDKEELISKSISFIQDCIDEIRHISKRLSSPHHSELELEEAVEQLVNSISTSSRLRITYKPYKVGSCNPSVDVQLAIYRIIQEHMTNIIKHAGAKKVEIYLACIANVLNLKIVDDGVGFDIKAKRKGIGISNIMNRAVAVNGKVVIQSTPGAGCSLNGNFTVT